MHRAAPKHRPAHYMGGQIAWGRGFFGEAFIADLTKPLQVASLLAIDRKEAALFGLAACALTKSPAKTILSIGGESSAITQGLAHLAAIYSAKFALFEPDTLHIAKFLYELELNAIHGDLDCEIVLKFLGNTRDKGASTCDSPNLLAYLRARGRLPTAPQLDRLCFRAVNVQEELIKGAALVWIEPKGSSRAIAEHLLPKLSEDALVLMRLDPQNVGGMQKAHFLRACHASGRSLYSLPSGRKCVEGDIPHAAGATWLALVPKSHLQDLCIV